MNDNDCGEILKALVDVKQRQWYGGIGEIHIKARNFYFILSNYVAQGRTFNARVHGRNRGCRFPGLKHKVQVGGTYVSTDFYCK